MEALAGLPGWESLFVLARHPCAACGVEQVLRAEDVDGEEELRVLDGTVHMTLRSEVDHIVDVVLRKEFVCQFAVSDVAFDEEATLVVDVVLDGA